MKHLKPFIALLLIVSSLLLSSCETPPESSGLVYSVYDDHVAVCGYSGNLENVYIHPTYKGLPVEYILGKKDSYFIGSSRTAMFEGENLKKVYFPWCTRSEKSSDDHTAHRAGNGVVVLFTRFNDMMPVRRSVVSLPTYEASLKTGKIGRWSTTNIVSDAWIKPANVAFIFNYPDAPNYDYFLIDLIETTGKIQKPPYDPEREGYRFAGWYKDAECTVPWDFYTDLVEIKYDDNGERIYEEIRLYAKWELAVPVTWVYRYIDAPNNNIYLKTLETPNKTINAPDTPERNGYVFAGWYKDAECTIPWNFDSDIVAINYDDNGERIYEEISLYAKWKIKNWWEFW